MNRLVATVGIFLTFGTLAWADAGDQDRIFSRQKAFRIPFQIPDPREQKDLQEVQLYVSRDGGRWEKYTASAPDVPPDKRSFTFRTEQDGEYCFAVRTLDRRGGFNPAEESAMQVGLRVMVDSDVPKIILRPGNRTGREVGVEWEVHDRNLDLDTLKLEYRAEGQENWQPVPGVVSRFLGQTTWMPDSPGPVTVRCQIEDRAKNLGIASLMIEPGLPATGSISKTTTSSGDRSPSGPSFLSQDAGSIPGSRKSGFNTEAPRNPGKSTGRDAGSFGSTGGSREPVGDGGYTTDEFESLADRPRTAKSPAGSAPGIRETSQSPASAPAAAGPIDRQVVRDPEVSLDYQIDDEGPSGVSIIEVWITSDMGRTWSRVGEDPDRRSPFNVRLGGDGLYGLTMVAKSGVGLGDTPPVAGDEPQTWVEVDTTAPQVRLFTPEVGHGADQGSIVITWKAEDPNLGDHSVSLFYTDGPANGEWKQIISGIDNSGRYVWRVNGPMPGKLRVGIEVTDMAGNRQMAESNEMTLDSARPKPRISKIKPAGEVRR